MPIFATANVKSTHLARTIRSRAKTLCRQYIDIASLLTAAPAFFEPALVLKLFLSTELYLHIREPLSTPITQFHQQAVSVGIGCVLCCLYSPFRY